MLQDRRTVTILTLALCFVYVALRVWRLTDSCLWFDEIFSVHAAEHSWNSLFWFVAQDLIHPPLFYIMLKFWISVGGESLIWLRLFPVLFSVLALVPFIHLCRELNLKTSAALLALAFLAINGSLIKYAQEVRMYAPLLFFSLLSLWLFARFYYRGKNIWLLTIVNVLLIYTHYFGWFVIATEVAAIFIFQRVKIRHVLFMSAIAFVAFVPWMIAVAKAASAGADVTQNIGWMTRPGLRAIFDFAFDVIEPFYFQQSSAEATTILFVTLPLLIAIAIAKLFYLIDWKKQEDKSAFYLMSIFVLVPMVLAFAISWLSPVSVWGSRHLVLVFGPVSILIAMMITAIHIRALRYVLTTAIVLLFGIAFIRSVWSSGQTFIWCAWEPAAVHAAEQGPPQVYVFEDIVAYHFWRSLSEHGGVKVTKIQNIEGVTEDKAYFLPRGFDEVNSVDVNDVKDSSLWIAYRGQSVDETKQPLATFLSRGYKVANSGTYKAAGENALLVLLKK